MRKRRGVVAGRADPDATIESASDQDVFAPLDVGKCGEEWFPEACQYSETALKRVYRVRAMPGNVWVIQPLQCFWPMSDRLPRERQ